MTMRKYGARSFKRPMPEEKEMSEVKRYDLTESCDTGEIDITPVPRHFEGLFVSWEDYAALKAERDALAAENLALLSACRSLAEECAQTASEVDLTMEEIRATATDAYANQLRAEGALVVQEKLQRMARVAHKSEKETIYALSLKAGEIADTLCKEGGNG